MLAAGRAANEKRIPGLFGTVGAGASDFRNQAAARILESVRVSVLRGNASEVRFLAGLASETRGVDASQGDTQDAGNAQVAARLAGALQCVVAVTGQTDIVTDGKRIVLIENGHPMLSCLTGTGCMCSSLVGAFCGASKETPLEATAAALLSMAIAGELAFEKAGHLGNGSFRVALLDAVSRMDAQTIRERARMHETTN